MNAMNTLDKRKTYEEVASMTRSIESALHSKILVFLAGELARREARQCVTITLFYVPGGGHADDGIRSWTRDEKPDLFESLT